MPLKVLFIGGSGLISQACTELAVKTGMELVLLNRGLRGSAPSGPRQVVADVNDAAAVASALGGESFDAVVDWIAFTPADVRRDIQAFKGRCGQYVFISSASAYQKPPQHYRVTESTPLENPYWEYSRNKIACENLCRRAQAPDFPVTIVRPSYTYGPPHIPLAIGGGGYTIVKRMRQGKKILVHGDGTSLWTNTHRRDFAAAFIPLLGNTRALGEAFHITSDEVLNWNQITLAVAQAAGVEADLLHVPSDFVAALDPGLGASLLGDKAWSMVFDNGKIRSLVPGFKAQIPFAAGMREAVEWFDADPSRRQVDEKLDKLMDRIVEAWK